MQYLTQLFSTFPLASFLSKLKDRFFLRKTDIWNICPTLIILGWRNVLDVSKDCLKFSWPVVNLFYINSWMSPPCHFCSFPHLLTLLYFLRESPTLEVWVMLCYVICIYSLSLYSYLAKPLKAPSMPYY